MANATANFGRGVRGMPHADTSALVPKDSIDISPTNTETTMHLLAFLVFGLVVGLIARAVLPGPQHMGAISTMLVGIVGSLLGGVFGNLLFGGRWDEPITAGWIGSILGSILLLVTLGRSRSSLFRA